MEVDGRTQGMPKSEELQPNTEMGEIVEELLGIF